MIKKVNIKEELQKQRDSSVESEKELDSIEGLKLLLENNASQERDILKEAGLDHNLKQMEKQKGINLERKKFEEKLNDQFFTEKEIKELCMKYNLRFLKSNKYKGAIEPVLGSKILNFFKEKNIDAASYEASNNLFIMAPAKAFNLEEIPVPPRAKTDPAIFYKVNSAEGNMYALIHKWGNDFNVGRRILGTMYENPANFNVFNGALKFAIILTAYSLFWNPMNVWAILSILGISAVAQLITFAALTDFSGRGSNAERKYKLKFNENNWNSDQI